MKNLKIGLNTVVRFCKVQKNFLFLGVCIWYTTFGFKSSLEFSCDSDIEGRYLHNFLSVIPVHNQDYKHNVSATASAGTVCKNDSCGVRTHASEDSGTWVHRLRPLGQTVDVESSPWTPRSNFKMACVSGAGGRYVYERRKERTAERVKGWMCPHVAHWGVEGLAKQMWICATGCSLKCTGWCKVYQMN